MYDFLFIYKHNYCVMHLALLQTKRLVPRYLVRFGSGQGEREPFCLSNSAVEPDLGFFSEASPTKYFILQAFGTSAGKTLCSEVSDKVWFWPGRKGEFLFPNQG